jgi:uncharacterized membrane protein
MTGAVKKLTAFTVKTFVAGALIVTPIYLACLLLLKVMKSLSGVVRPLTKLLPESLPAEDILCLLLVLFFCFFIGLVVRTSVGSALWQRIENALFLKVPGYETLRSLTRQLAGETWDRAWKPVLAEIEEALVPAFLIEELEDGSFTVFVPSAPTPFAGSIYILTPDRVHLLNISVTHAIKTISRWGSGSRDLVAAMQPFTPVPGTGVHHDPSHTKRRKLS